MTSVVKLPVLDFRWYQKPVWNALNDKGIKRAITIWPRRNGKDLTAINIIAAMSQKRVGLYYYMAPFYQQVRQIIWLGQDGTGERFIDYIPEGLIERKLDQEMRIYLENGSQIKLCGSDNIDSIVGSNPVGIVMTEFSLHKPEAWDYLRPILAENGGWALFNGTPRGLNHFYRMAEGARKDTKDKWFYQYLTRDDTGIPSLDAIQDDRDSGMPESLIEQEYYCSWTSSSEETFIPLDIVEPAINRRITEDAIQAHHRILGVDPAYAEKGDLAAIARRQGPLLHPLEYHQGLDPMALASRVVHYIKTWNPHAVCIDTGRGEGVISRLRQLGYDDLIVPVEFAGKTYSDLYHRKKDEIWGAMRDWFYKMSPSIPAGDEKLVTDLTCVQFELNDKGFIQLESKKALRSRGFKSTDGGDAVAVTFAEEWNHQPVLTQAMQQQGIDQNLLNSLHFKDSGQQDYEPLEYMDQYMGIKDGWF